MTETTISANEKKNLYFWFELKRAVDYIYIAWDMSYDAITTVDQTKTPPKEGTTNGKKLIKSEFKVELMNQCRNKKRNFHFVFSSSFSFISLHRIGFCYLSILLFLTFLKIFNFHSFSIILWLFGHQPPVLHKCFKVQKFA